MTTTNRLLSTLEMVGACVALVLAILWIREPSGPYEPYTFLVCLICTTAVDIARRRLRQHSAPVASLNTEPETKAGPPTRVQEGTLDLNVLATPERRILISGALPVTAVPRMDDRLGCW